MIDENVGKICLHCGGPIHTERSYYNHGRDVEYSDYCANKCPTTMELERVNALICDHYRTLESLKLEKQKLSAVRAPSILAREVLADIKLRCVGVDVTPETVIKLLGESNDES